MSDITITVLDGGGSITLPSSKVHVVLGTCSGGTANIPGAYRNPNSLATDRGYGPSIQAAALCLAAGATVIHVKCTTITPGVASAVTSTAWGTSVLTVTGAPHEAYLVKVRVRAAGTIGTVGCAIDISLDAGRSYGPIIQLGTATSLAITGTNLTLNFAAGDLTLAGYSTFGCTEPLTNTASIQSALLALAASPYGATGWGSLQIAGVITGGNATTINGYLNTLASTYRIHTRAVAPLRDVLLPAAYGGAGETEATWLAALVADVAAVSTVRVDGVAGFYNVTSQYPVAFAGAPNMRMPLSWIVAARMVTIPIQELASRVDTGSLAQIIIDAANDPSDGFVYHDASVVPGFDNARLTCARRRSKKSGFYLEQHRLLAPAGSVFALHPRGGVMDVGCDLLYEKGSNYVNSTLQLVPPAGAVTNGMVTPAQAAAIETKLKADYQDAMIGPGLITGVVIVVDQTNNVRTTGNVNIAVTLEGLGYAINITATIGYAG